MSPIELGLIFTVSLLGLFGGAERFVEGAASIAKQFQMPSMVIGMVLVGFATSFPEMLVSLLAALQGRASLSLGNAMGSYVANIGLVLGVSAMLVPLTVNPVFFRRDMPILTVSLGVAWVLFSDHAFSRLDGLVLLSLLLVFIGWLTWSSLSDRARNQQAHGEVLAACRSKRSSVMWLIIGFFMLYGSAKLLIFSALGLAGYFQLSEMSVGLTVVAIGTSLPELAASIAAALKGEHDIAVGNVIGSNIFGVLGVMAMPGIIAPGAISYLILWRDFSVMGLITLVLWATAFGRWGRTMRITRLEGGILLAIFCGYIWVVIRMSGWPS